MEIYFTPRFRREFKKLPALLQDEVNEKIALFQNEPDHPHLRAHKLHGRLKDFYAFSVNYRYRIIFEYGKTRQSIHLLMIGDHALYE
jgi:addiction module RelE/StbE family toxin